MMRSSLVLKKHSREALGPDQGNQGGPPRDSIGAEQHGACDLRH